jgi:FkbM family methyltransferase
MSDVPYQWLRVVSWCNRFRTLRRAMHGFAGVPAGTLIRRRLFGYQIELDVSRSSAQQLLLLEGERFIDERFLLRKLLRPGMTVVDVGANIGYYLLLAEQAVGTDGRVICIEPSSENLPELRRNIEINALANVCLYAIALGDHEGETGLQTGINSGIIDGRGGTYTVPLRRLDQVVAERVDFLKIDVEGYEGQVLAGAEDLLATQKPTLFLELHPHIVGRFGFSTSGILADLKRHYAHITLYENQAAASQSIIDKIAIRYFGRDRMCVISNPSAYVERYDRGDQEHTFWAVCTA